MLFKTTAEIQNYMELNSHVNFPSLKSSIRAAEKELIIPVIGRSFFLDLDKKYNENSLTAQETSLIQTIQAALAPYTMFLYVPKAEVNITDGGILRNETDSSKTAYQYQVTNLRKSLLNESETAVEFLIGFLEDMKADYPAWTSSNEFKKYRSLFIKTGGEFQDFFRTHSPYRNYWAMRSVMEDVEQQIIKVAIGEDLFKTLKDEDQAADPDFTLQEKELLYKLKKAIANFTIANATSQLAVRIDENGISVTSASTLSSKDDESKRGAAPDNQISQLLREAKASGAIWLGNALAYLKKNASETVFPEFFTWQKNITAINHNCADKEDFLNTLNGSFSLF